MTEAGHAVHDERLRAIMSELERETLSPWPQELDDEHSAAKSRRLDAAYAEARRVADALALAADRIPPAVAHVKMAEADRRGFLAQVDTLRDQSRALATIAASGDLDAMREMMSAISATCRSCHERFRDFSGPLSRGHSNPALQGAPR
jgi:hypothetical protein